MAKRRDENSTPNNPQGGDFIDREQTSGEAATSNLEKQRQRAAAAGAGGTRAEEVPAEAEQPKEKRQGISADLCPKCGRPRVEGFCVNPNCPSYKKEKPEGAEGGTKEGEGVSEEGAEKPEGEPIEAGEKPEGEAPTEGEAPSEAPGGEVPEGEPGAAPEGAIAEGAPEAAEGVKDVGAAAGEAGKDVTIAGEAGKDTGLAVGAGIGTETAVEATVEAGAAPATGGTSLAIPAFKAGVALLIFFCIAIMTMLVIAVIAIWALWPAGGRSPHNTANLNNPEHSRVYNMAVAAAGGGSSGLVRDYFRANDPASIPAVNTDLRDNLNTMVAASGTNKVATTLAVASSQNSNPYADLENQATQSFDTLNNLTSDTQIAEQAQQGIDTLNTLETTINQNSGSAPQQNVQNALNDIQTLRSDLDNISFFTFTETQNSALGGQAVTLGKTKLVINEVDKENIKKNEVDLRVMRLLVYLTQQGWDMLKISRIVQFDPDSEEAKVDSESETNVSAHSSGQAIDISIIGTVKCHNKRVPCYVRYQGGSGQTIPGVGGLLNSPMSYDIPRGNNFSDLFSGMALDGLASNFGAGNLFGSNFADFAQGLGTSAILSELGIDPGSFNLPFNSRDLGMAILGENIGLSPEMLTQALSGGGSLNRILGENLVESLYGMPLGALRGGSESETLRNMVNGQLRDAFNFEGTSWNGDLSNSGVGRAVLERVLGTTDESSLRSWLSGDTPSFAYQLGINRNDISSFINRGMDFNRFADLVGGNFLSDLGSTFQGVGLERALGLPEGVWSGIVSGNTQAIENAGANILSRYLHIDELMNIGGPADLSNGILQNAMSSGYLSRADLNTLVTGSDADRARILENLGRNLSSSLTFDSLDSNLRAGMANLGYNPFQIGRDQILEVLGNPTRLSQLANDLTSNFLLNVSQGTTSIFSGSNLSAADLQGMRNGNFRGVLVNLGSNLIEQQFGLPDDFLRNIFRSDNATGTMQTIIQGGMASFAERLGLDLSGSYPDLSWLENGRFPTEIGELIFENRGLNRNSFSGNIQNIITGNGADRVASAFGLTRDELQTVVGGGNATQTVSSILSGIESELHLPTGSIIPFLQGRSGADALSTLAGTSSMNFLGNLSATNLMGQLGFPAGYLPSGNILNALLGNNSSDTQNFFGGILGINLDSQTGNTPGFFLSILQNHGDGFRLLETEGMRQLSEFLGGTNSSSLFGNFSSAFLSGGSFNASTLMNLAGIGDLADATSFFSGNAIRALTSLDIGSLVSGLQGQFGNVASAFNYGNISDFLFGGANGAFGGGLSLALMDSAMNSLNSFMPFGAAGAILQGSPAQFQNLATSFLENQAGLPLGSLGNIQNFISGNGGLANLSNLNISAVAQNLGLPISQMQGLFDSLGGITSGLNFANMGDWASSAFTNYLGSQFGIGPGMLSTFQGLLSGGANPLALLGGNFMGQFGMGLDSIFGASGITNSMLMGLVGGNFGQFAFMAANPYMAAAMMIFGSRCPNMVQIARKRVRTLDKQLLYAPDTPRQIITFRKEDMNYLNGIDPHDFYIDGDHPPLPDRALEKYGPKEKRINKGVFILPSMWDHIHAGY